MLEALSAALCRADGLAKTAGTQRINLHDGRAATCLALFQVYLTLLLEFATQPERATPVFRLQQSRNGWGQKGQAARARHPKS
ncbi:hypothetical protein GCM10028822_11440 [Hymenobacter terrigena]